MLNNFCLNLLIVLSTAYYILRSLMSGTFFSIMGRTVHAPSSGTHFSFVAVTVIFIFSRDAYIELLYQELSRHNLLLLQSELNIWLLLLSNLRDGRSFGLICECFSSSHHPLILLLLSSSFLQPSPSFSPPVVFSCFKSSINWILFFQVLALPPVFLP